VRFLVKDKNTSFTKNHTELGVYAIALTSNKKRTNLSSKIVDLPQTKTEETSGS